MRDGGVNGPAVQPQQDPPRQPQAEAEQSPATVEVQLLPPTQLPACLRNTLEKNCSSKALVWPADVLLLAAHAAMLDAQFVPSWAVAFGSDAVARLHVPASCRLSRTTWRITYHLVLAGAAGGQAGGTDGRGSSNAGAVRQHESGTCVVLHSSSIGSGGVVLAVSAQHHARHVSLHAASYVQPMRPSVVGATNGACGLTPSGTAVLPTGGDGGLVIGDHWLSPLAARRLWTTLKDSLAVPMMFAAFAEAGLPPPAGLLALPVELKERLLKLLGVSQSIGTWHARAPATQHPCLCSPMTWLRCAARAPSCAIWPRWMTCGALCLSKSSPRALHGASLAITWHLEAAGPSGGSVKRSCAARAGLCLPCRTSPSRRTPCSIHSRSRPPLAPLVARSSLGAAPGAKATWVAFTGRHAPMHAKPATHTTGSCMAAVPCSLQAFVKAFCCSADATLAGVGTCQHQVAAMAASLAFV